ncbi:MAG: radical SAM protein [Candidatus Nitrosocaldus sp.]|nr:radical SAM protein [Candidatus Nitrosocaldus sp.]MDW8275528.1 radical SAM protein [Candidatus Nitrosocaldus sp.]
MLTYIEPLYRPPSEADSLILQVTIGCSYNRCSFCSMYRSKRYEERPWDEIRAEIDYAAREYPSTRRVFLADGDALNISTEYMLKILEHLHRSFPRLERVSCYAMPKNLLQKSREDLVALSGAGLKLLYIGIESGSDTVLRKVTKGATSRGIVDGCLKAKGAGIQLSCMLILGLGGRRYSREHALESARVASTISPEYLAALTLMLDDVVKDEFMSKFNEPFEPLSDLEVLDELRLLVEHIQPRDGKIVFRANHASNPYPIKAVLPDDRASVIALIDGLKEMPNRLRPGYLRRF